MNTATCGPFSSYTALGDSYACGFGATQRLKLCNGTLDGFGSVCTTEACGQDVGSYGVQFAHTYGIRSFQYLACNGNDTGAVLDDQVNSKAFGDPDLVTVNMGGDDQSFFAAAVLACVYNYNSTNCDQAIESASTIIARLPDRYARVFMGIKKKVRPQTKVVGMGYAQFFGNIGATDCAWPLNLATKVQKQRLNTLAQDMNKHLQDEALKAGYLYADVDAAFEGQRMCDQTGSNSFKSLFQFFPRAGYDTGDEFYHELSVFHPTADGQAIMLRVLRLALGC